MCTFAALYNVILDAHYEKINFHTIWTYIFLSFSHIPIIWTIYLLMKSVLNSKE